MQPLKLTTTLISNLKMDKANSENKRIIDRICFNNSEEIKILRKRSHDYGNRIMAIDTRVEGNSSNIVNIIKEVDKVQNKHISTLEKGVATLQTDVKNISDKIKSMDTKFWAIIILLIATLLGVITS